MDIFDKSTINENTNVLRIYEILRKIWQKYLKMEKMN